MTMKPSSKDKSPEMPHKTNVESVIHAHAFQKPVVPNFSYDAEKQHSPEQKPEVT
jgi:hypothetical protein